ncbi:MAG: aminotransferase class I/II-fold pyridoxal phosphate-dependent enzyme, partial [Bacteroidota bacterium]
KKFKIFLSPPHLSGEEIAYIQSALDQNWVAPVGENLDEFEKIIRQYVGVKQALALQSGTAALHLALLLLEVKAGDEVLCPTFTFAATANPILYQKATPVWVDSEADTWNLCPDNLEKAIQDRRKKGKKPKALMLVHLYGQSAKLEEIGQICQHYDIPIIEDAAEALGSSYEGKKLGSLGELGVLSFNGNKIITTSGGGMLLTNKDDYYQTGLQLATQARDPAPHYQHSKVGYNYRMSNILAGLGRGQMKVLSQRIESRRRIYTVYQEELGNIKNWFFQPELPGTFSNRWLTCLVTDSYQRREQIRLQLASHGIEARPLWKPLHLQPVFRSFPYYGGKRAEQLFERGICLPSGSQLKAEEQAQIIEIIRQWG